MMITLAIIGTYGIITLAAIHFALILPALYTALKNEQSPFLLPWILLIILLPLIGAVAYVAVYSSRKKHKSRFEVMLVEGPGEENTDRKDREIPAGVPKDTTTHILSRLGIFEDKGSYLQPDISPAGLAKEFNVSADHLSKTIKFYKKKRINHYINTLRIDYLIRELHSGSDYRKYRMKPLAKELGFATTKAFTMAFLRRTGMYPTLFIAELGYEEEEQWAFD